ncbi:beta-ketoacyl-ACP synthase II [Maridesulfovibrio bastinii]|uniref:beta-ketoacyl-ACP synthase II n=1 Tax=Maridesulfovibrio bastinii TaxID=47157 RepID=UPI00041635E1|nr:beta-ketoacyl-ACP synthase II [Maridesulfovibrio bastinii]
MKRVVVTGVSAISPIGNDIDTSWKNLLEGKSGIVPVSQFDATEYKSRIAGEVKDFDPKEYIPAKQVKRMERFTQFAVATAQQLVEQTGIKLEGDECKRAGVNIGVGLGGLETIEGQHDKLMKSGPKKITPFFIPIIIANMAAGQVSIFTGARGPNLCISTACASGTHAIGTAYTDIKLDRADVMICGGAESTVTPLGFAGFTALKALSTRNEDPTKASRPFDNGRDGFVMGEGCGLLLLESLDHAQKRGAKILAEVVGFGASSDAFHMTAPPEDGSGMALAMENAIREAGIPANAVDHINAHGTSTKLNDFCETTAIKSVFGEHAKEIAIAANKSQIGHLLGAAGGVEAAFSVKTLETGIIPGTINLTDPDPDCDLDYCKEGPREKQAEYALSNSFGFGGTNACILFKKFEN